MDDTAFRRYFTQSTQAYHRQYEALRAVVVDTARHNSTEFDTFGAFRECVGRPAVAATLLRWNSAHWNPYNQSGNAGKDGAEST